VSSLPDRALGTPGFQADDGSADPKVLAALDAFANGLGGSADVLAALAGGRLLVPVVAVLDQAGESADGVRVDKASHMATVSTTGRDGRRGQLAFTCTEAMWRWNPVARPVPVTTRRAAEAALADAADALVIDLAGPVTFSVDAGELRALAAGWRPVGAEHGGAAWAVAVGLAGQPENGTAASLDSAATAESIPVRRRVSGWAARVVRVAREALRGPHRQVR
jgi:hypothetical protein